MELNLRKARKLEQKIQSHVAKMSVKTSTTVRAMGELEDRMSKVEEARQQALTTYELRKRLTEARFAIRNMIAQANDQVGINALMNEREQLKELLSQYSVVEEVFSAESMEDDAKAKRIQLDKGENSYHFSTGVSVSVLTESDTSEIKDARAALLKRLEDVEDELSQKNVGAKVTLSEDIVTLLQSQGLA